MLYCIPFTLVNFEGEQKLYYDLSTCDFRHYCHSKIYTLSLALSMHFCVRHSCANRLLCSTFLFACLRCILHVVLCCSAICGTCLVVCCRIHRLTAQFVLTYSCLCDDWEKYSGILNCRQGASRMGENLPFYHCILSVVQPCRVFQILHP